MITAEQLHNAAYKLDGMESYPEDAEVDEFIEESTFHNHEIDPISLAYGISIGIIAGRDSTDNNDDKEQQ